MDYTDQIFSSFAGLGVPRSSSEDKYSIQSVLDNSNLLSYWQTYGKGTGFGSLVPGGQEVAIPVHWDLPFLEFNPYAQSTLTPPYYQTVMGFPALPVVASCSDTRVVGAAQQAYTPEVSNSIPWPSPSPPELPRLISTPTPGTHEPRRPQKRTRRKRASRPM